MENYKQSITNAYKKIIELQDILADFPISISLPSAGLHQSSYVLYSLNTACYTASGALAHLLSLNDLPENVNYNPYYKGFEVEKEVEEVEKEVEEVEEEVDEEVVESVCWADVYDEPEEEIVEEVVEIIIQKINIKICVPSHCILGIIPKSCSVKNYSEFEKKKFYSYVNSDGERDLYNHRRYDCSHYLCDDKNLYNIIDNMLIQSRNGEYNLGYEIISPVIISSTKNIKLFETFITDRMYYTPLYPNITLYKRMPSKEFGKKVEEIEIPSNVNEFYNKGIEFLFNKDTYNRYIIYSVVSGVKKFILGNDHNLYEIVNNNIQRAKEPAYWKEVKQPKNYKF